MGSGKNRLHDLIFWETLDSPIEMKQVVFCFPGKTVCFPETEMSLRLYCAFEILRGSLRLHFQCFS